MANNAMPLFVGVKLDVPIPHGIGTDQEGYVGKFPQHLTLCFKPTEGEMKIYKPLIGKKVIMRITHYGCNETHEGALVSLDESIPYCNPSRPHITISVANGGRAVDTPTAIDFEEIDDFYLTGTIEEFYSFYQKKGNVL